MPVSRTGCCVFVASSTVRVSLSITATTRAVGGGRRPCPSCRRAPRKRQPGTSLPHPADATDSVVVGQSPLLALKPLKPPRFPSKLLCFLFHDRILNPIPLPSRPIAALRSLANLSLADIDDFPIPHVPVYAARIRRYFIDRLCVFHKRWPQGDHLQFVDTDPLRTETA